MSYSSNGPNNIVEDFSLLFLNVVYYILIEGYCKKKKKKEDSMKLRIHVHTLLMVIGS